MEAKLCGPKDRGWLMRWLPGRAHGDGVFLVFGNSVDDCEIRTGSAMILRKLDIPAATTVARMALLGGFLSPLCLASSSSLSLHVPFSSASKPPYTSRLAPLV
jgi:hypothetical protein